MAPPLVQRVPFPAAVPVPGLGPERLSVPNGPSRGVWNTLRPFFGSFGGGSWSPGRLLDTYIR